MLKLPGPVVAWPLVTEIPLLSRWEKIGKTAKSAIWIPLRRVTIRPATVATRGDDTAGSNTRPSTVQPGSASCNALRRPQFSLNIVISCNALCRFFPPPLSSPPWTVFASYFYYSAVGLRLPILPDPPSSLHASPPTTNSASRLSLFAGITPIANYSSDEREE